MTSVIYSCDKWTTSCNKTYKGKPFFQKNIDPSNKDHKVELYVAERLLKTPLKNVVRVYEIIYYPTISIKYELLEVNQNYLNYEDIKLDLISGLKELHSINCVYIDIKEDNIGYCKCDKCWKIFDFDCSGIMTNNFTNWKIKPPNYYMMNNIKKFQKNVKKYLNIKNKHCKKSLISKINKIKSSKKLIKYDIFALFVHFGKKLN